MTQEESPSAPFEMVRSAYGAASGLYIELLGTVEQAAEKDRALLAGWGATLVGPVLDAGSGPGHWSGFLHALGVDVTGVDGTPEFVVHATATHPEVAFRLGDLGSLNLDDDSLGGVLAWFSLIHAGPEEVPGVLADLARAIRPGGSLLLGFFAGPELRPFDHRVVTAWAWPVAELAAVVAAVGLDVVDSGERVAPNGRILAHLVARRPS